MSWIMIQPKPTVFEADKSTRVSGLLRLSIAGQRGERGREREQGRERKEKYMQYRLRKSPESALITGN